MTQKITVLGKLQNTVITPTGALAGVLLLAAFNTHAVIVDVPLANPGAETGDMSGWTVSSGNNYSSNYGVISSHSGSYYYGFNNSKLPSLSELLDGTYPPRLSMTSSNIDLSAYTGNIENIILSTWRRDSNLKLNVDDYVTGQTYEYALRQLIGMSFYDSSGHYISGLSSWGYSNEERVQWTRGETNALGPHWDTYKDDVASVTIRLTTTFMDWGTNGAPDLMDINQANIGDAYYSWIGVNGNSYTGYNLNGFSGGELPIIAFDDISMQVDVSAVPVPGAIWLFGSGLLGLIGFSRRKVV